MIDSILSFLEISNLQATALIMFLVTQLQPLSVILALCVQSSIVTNSLDIRERKCSESDDQQFLEN